MYRRIVLLLIVYLAAARISLYAQDFRLFDRQIQIHGFASQGFVHTNDNNWLTMNTSHVGSGEFTDFGVNASTQVTDRLRIGAQLYDRNVGALGAWHPTLDWAFADYRFKPWFGLRAGKVKTPLGLYNDTQDMEFLHTWAMLPQGVYPLDLRSQTIAHVGADAYGYIDMRKVGQVNYTVYGGEILNDPYSGYQYGIQGLAMSFGGKYTVKDFTQTVFGTDVRWNTPAKGLMVGISAIAQSWNIREQLAVAGLAIPTVVTTPTNHTLAYYGEYSLGRFRFDGEYRRNPTVVSIAAMNGPPPIQSVGRSAFVSAAYRLHKRLEVGTYHSWFYMPDFNQQGSGPSNHELDQVVAARIDLARHFDLKIEGHFIDGYANSEAFRGFYPQNNPAGLDTNTRALVVRTGFNF